MVLIMSPQPGDIAIAVFDGEAGRQPDQRRKEVIFKLIDESRTVRSSSLAPKYAGDPAYPLACAGAKVDKHLPNVRLPDVVNYDVPAGC